MNGGGGCRGRTRKGWYVLECDALDAHQEMEMLNQTARQPDGEENKASLVPNYLT